MHGPVELERVEVEQEVVEQFLARCRRHVLLSSARVTVSTHRWVEEAAHGRDKCVDVPPLAQDFEDAHGAAKVAFEALGSGVSSSLLHPTSSSLIPSFCSSHHSSSLSLSPSRSPSLLLEHSRSRTRLLPFGSVHED